MGERINYDRADQKCYQELTLPKGLDWEIWRIVTDTRISASLVELEQWTMADLVRAHQALDSLDDANYQAQITAAEEANS